MFYVYILYAKDFDRFYIGQTNNLENRLIRHNMGYVKSTKSYLPWEMVFYEKYQTRSEAMVRENYLKSLKSKIKIREIVDASR
jgi:putative endonuclease